MRTPINTDHHPIQHRCNHYALLQKAGWDLSSVDDVFDNGEREWWFTHQATGRVIREWNEYSFSGACYWFVQRLNENQSVTANHKTP